jgi:hypothetical protein
MAGTGGAAAGGLRNSGQQPWRHVQDGAWGRQRLDLAQQLLGDDVERDEPARRGAEGRIWWGQAWPECGWGVGGRAGVAEAGFGGDSYGLLKRSVHVGRERPRKEDELCCEAPCLRSLRMRAVPVASPRARVRPHLFSGSAGEVCQKILSGARRCAVVMLWSMRTSILARWSFQPCCASL